MTSSTKPTAEQVEKALALLTQPQLYRRFFEGLKNPEWIAPLREKKFFSQPPAVERDEARGTIGFRAWPESEFLLRMAPIAPKEVCETILAVPATDNFRVHVDFVEAAVALPADLAAKIAEMEIEWLRTQDVLFILYPEKLGKLAVHLAAGGKAEISLHVFEALLEIRSKAAEKEKHEYLRESKITPRFDIWHYRDILKKQIPELASRLGLPLLKVLCGILDQYLKVAEKSRVDSGRDHSYVWRPAIESHSQNHDGQLNSALVSGCRDAAETLLAKGVAPLDEVLGEVGQYKWTVFRRLSLHLIRRFAAANSAILQAAIGDEKLFDDISVRHEYTLLLRERIQDVPPELFNAVLGWIEKGPDLEDWKKGEAELEGKHPQNDEAERYRKMWQRERLSWFQDKVPDLWKEKFADVLAKFPAPDHPEFPFYMSSGWVGPESPKSAAEIKKLSVTDLASFLSTWEPQNKGLMEATREGLGRTVTDAVKSDPERFSIEAKKFTGLDPTYVRAFFVGLEEALRAKKKINAEEVLNLAEWAVSQPRALSGPRGRDEDPDWGWARKVIASFLGPALEDDHVPLGKREQVWRVLSAIINDPDPTPEDEPEPAAENSMGPETLSINTARGQALHSVVRYALWIRRQMEKEPAAAQRLQRGFAEMPEVREVLDAHLDLKNDPSPAVRSVYGQWFPWLVLLDVTWAKQAAKTIFPTPEATDRCRTAAWLTYASFCPPYDNVFDAIPEIYACAIATLGQNAGVKSRYGDPDERLGQHLVAFYWRGRMGLEPTSPLVKYFSDASDKMRASVITHIGRNLKGTKDEIPPEVLGRIKNLWDWLMDGPLASTVGPETAAAFGWWFISEKLSDDWAIPRLVAATKLAKNTEPEHFVVERLPTLADKWPVEVLSVFDTLARNDKEGWRVMHWGKAATTVLDLAYRSGDPNAKRAATELIHYLGTRGYLEFGKILS